MCITKLNDWVVLFGGPKTGTLYQVTVDTNDFLSKLLKIRILLSLFSQIKCSLSRLEFTKMLVRKASREDPAQTAFFRSSLIWVCTIFSKSFWSEISEHLRNILLVY